MTDRQQTQFGFMRRMPEPRRAAAPAPASPRARNILTLEDVRALELLRRLVRARDYRAPRILYGEGPIEIRGLS